MEAAAIGGFCQGRTQPVTTPPFAAVASSQTAVNSDPRSTTELRFPSHDNGSADRTLTP
jgi:hypothetical protein